MSYVTALIFSRRFSSEKCPTITVASFFFVRPQTSPCMYHFLVQALIGLWGTQRPRARVPGLARNFRASAKADQTEWSPLSIFSALCDFFWKFFAFKGSPSSFVIFCNKLDFQKAQRVPLLQS